MLLSSADPAEVAAAADPWLGRVIDGRYRVQARLGTGGMGVVYRVEHLYLGKTAAMKVLAPDTAAKPEALRRFRLEAQSVSKLNHPNIVQTFDFGQADGALYLVMEFIKGDDLASLLRRDGPWSFARAARYFIQVCSGLTEAHEAGIIHRDLKPENLMVIHRRDSEHAKVLDFGLAKLRERDGEARAISSGGQVIGTPYYMAPEQVRGEDLDARADIYSLGATLYRVLTGEPPFDAPSPMSVLSKHLTDDVVPPRDRAPGRALPPEADRIVLRAMAKAAEDRYASAADVQQDLERALAAPGVDARSAETVALRRPGAPARVVGDAPTLLLASGVVRTNVTAASAAASAAVATASAATDPALPSDRSISDVASTSAEEDLDRLRRSDVDEYEWTLRRQRWQRRVVAPLIGLIVVAAAVFAFVRRPWERAADGVEHEPNNTPGYATTLVQGPMRGAIGAPLNDRESDADYYRVPASKGPRVLHARLEGIPGVDLVIDLYDGQGRRVAKSDARGRGLGEWLQPTSIGPTEAYLAVREVWIEGTKPTANALDPYTLTARWGPPQPDWELEPNDWPTAATPLDGGRMRGYLGSAEDRDWFSITPTKTGLVMGSVNAPAGVDVIVFRDEDAKKVVNKRGAGDDEQFALEGEAGKPLFIGLARKLDAKKDPKEQALQGLDDPYELTVNVTDK
jgi:eukaryotic-like serine/threonine-protein kinase